MTKPTSAALTLPRSEPSSNVHEGEHDLIDTNRNQSFFGLDGSITFDIERGQREWNDIWSAPATDENLRETEKKDDAYDGRSALTTQMSSSQAGSNVDPSNVADGFHSVYPAIT